MFTVLDEGVRDSHPTGRFEEKPDEDDAIINENCVLVKVDSYSQKYLKGVNVYYIEFNWFRIQD